MWCSSHTYLNDEGWKIMNRQGEQGFKQYLQEQIDWLQTKKKELDVNIQYNRYTELEVREMTLRRVLLVFGEAQEFK